MPDLSIQHVQLSREQLIVQVRGLKADIIGMLESGSRDFETLARMVRQYADAQNAADVLSGQSRIKTL